MSSLDYDSIISRLFKKIRAYDLIELSDEEANEFLCDWIHSSLANPEIRKLFSSLSFNDEAQCINYEMAYTVDEDSDKEFLIELTACGSIVEWLSPQIYSSLLTRQTYGSKEEKFYSESAHMSQLHSLLQACEIKISHMVNSRGASWNTWLDGKK